MDERIVGRKPASLTFPEAAAMPLTTITAWELLFHRIRIPVGEKSTKRTLLVINGAGGVGSILIQLARQLTGLTVIATASRPESRAWAADMGAHLVIDHRQPLNEALVDAGFATVDLVASLTATEHHWPAIAEAIAPEGHVAVIDDPKEARYRALQTQECVGPLGVHVYEARVRNRRHDRAAQFAEPGGRSVRRGVLAPYDEGGLRPHQCSQSPARPCSSGKREGHRKKRSHGLLKAEATRPIRQQGPLDRRWRRKPPRAELVPANEVAQTEAGLAVFAASKGHDAQPAPCRQFA